MYLIFAIQFRFKTDQVYKVKGLLDSDSEVSVITSAYVVKLSLITYKTSI